ncbi:hypothetical protein L4C42_18685 [Vibrio wakamikoensis]|uniref:hypothetical protein n=1 Tax=Vibrio TaxID=662 RepID=UPI003AB59A3C
MKLMTCNLVHQAKRQYHKFTILLIGGGMLGFAIASTPLYQIFFSPSVTGKPVETMITIREYDWEIFGEAMSSVSKISKDRVLQIAEPLTWTTSGSEQKFWRCISEAAL